MQYVLLDTGPLVAIFNSKDSHHSECVTTLESLRGKLVTTEAVLTEAMHFLDNFSSQNLVFDFLASGAVEMRPHAGHANVRDLMEKYSDIPMDYADGTLVTIAATLGTDRVFTLDRRGFQSYRIDGKRPFVLLP